MFDEVLKYVIFEYLKYIKKKSTQIGMNYYSAHPDKILYLKLIFLNG